MTLLVVKAQSDSVAVPSVYVSAITPGAHVAAGDDDFVGGEGAVRFRGGSQRVRVAFGKTGRGCEGAVLEGGMSLIDAGIDDADFDARSGIACSADRGAAPGLLDVAQGQLVGEVEAAQRHHAFDAGQIAQRGSL